MISFLIKSYILLYSDNLLFLVLVDSFVLPFYLAILYRILIFECFKIISQFSFGYAVGVGY